MAFFTMNRAARFKATWGDVCYLQYSLYLRIHRP